MDMMKNAGCGCVFGAMGMFCLLVLLVVGGILLICGSVSSLEGFDSSEYGSTSPECDKPLSAKWVRGDGDEDAPKIVQVRLRGVIAPSSERETWLDQELSAYESALKAIRAATDDDDVLGLYLFLDTPGGTVTEADILANAVTRFRESKKDRFVFVQMGSICCSGGYYIAAGADCIMAYPTTVTGSIGVIMNGLNAAELAKKVGVKSVTIASGSNKALLDPLEPVNPEHVKILKQPVEQDYERFVSIVAKGRNLPVDTVRSLADGRIFSARDAKDAKLIDCIGYDEDAWKKLAEMAKGENVRIYRYDEPFSWRSLFSASSFMKYGRGFAEGMMSVMEKTPKSEYRMN